MKRDFSTKKENENTTTTLENNLKYSYVYIHDCLF